MQESRAKIEPPRHKLTRALRFLAFGALGAGLLWGSITHSLVAALVEIEPLRAWQIRSDDPGALLALADRTMDQVRARKVPRAGSASGAAASTSDDEAEARRHADGELRRWATTVLAQEPGNAQALAILGELARQTGADDVAAALLGASARRSMRNPAVLGWLIDDALKRRDWPLVMQHADTMMRFHWQAIPPLTPLLAQMLLDPAALPAVKEAVAAAPPWRLPFFRVLPDAIADARAPLELFLALKETPNPPTATELRPYLDFLIQRKFFDLAYYTWLQFLPPEQLASVGLLFNGSFESHPTGLPFDWRPSREGAAGAAIERRADRPSEFALVVRFGQGRADLDYIAQLLRLLPGHYQVEGMAMGDVRGPRGMRWRVWCLDEPMPPIGESAMLGGRLAPWTTFSFTVTVPETGCAAQELRLVLDARTPSEQLVSGAIWFDELSVRRAP